MTQKAATEIRPGVSLCPKHPEVERHRQSGNGNWYCTKCSVATANRFRATEHGVRYYRERHWRRQGINLNYEEWESMEQKCTICGSTKKLVPDHDHGTGQVRGVLCTRCNSAIGLFGDDVETMQKAIMYLGGDPCQSVA